MTAAEIVFRHLLGAITSGAWAPGTFETEERLAAHWNVSRTPLRDAIRRLESLRLVLREPARGLRVPALSIEEMGQLSVTREVLEGLLAAGAAARVASGLADLQRLHAILERHRRVLKLDDAELALSIGTDFHEELRRLCGNPPAAACHETVMLGLERYRHLARRVPGRGGRIAREHAEILQAIAAGRPKAAESAMRSHIAAGRAVYLDVLSHALEKPRARAKNARTGSA